MMSVAVDGTKAGFVMDAARPLFRAPVAVQPGYQYAVTRDGQRFLINTSAAPSAPVTIVWTALLKR